jgi:hypothetical protein
MALAKKGSRLISIDGVTYRWAVSSDSGYMVLVVETNDEPGQRLEAVFDYHYQQVELDSRFIQGRAISPGIVRQVIVIALERGWQPSKHALPPFRVDNVEQFVGLSDEIAN